MEVVFKPWGGYEVLFDTKYTKVKELQIEPKQRLSYQSHKHRAEVWVVTKGVATVTINGLTSKHKAGESITIPVGVKHRLENEGDDVLYIIEVQTGMYFGEDDIIRYEDDYNRLEQ
jgi:mannose-6-phosphate isomerase